MSETKEIDLTILIQLLTDSENQPHQFVDSPGKLNSILINIFGKMVNRRVSTILELREKKEKVTNE